MTQAGGRLAGKVAIVTGGSKGIGARIAEVLAGEGAAVAITFRTDSAGAEAVRQRIASAGGRAEAFALDVARIETLDGVFADVETTLGPLDILVNNAGCYAFAPIKALTDEQYQTMFDTNVRGPLFATQSAVRCFGKRGGVVLNIGSAAATLCEPYSSAYSASKAALNAMTKTLAKELGPRSIRVNALCPGVTETEGMLAIADDFAEYIANTKVSTPLGRLGSVDEIASAAAFLVSDEASWISGECILASGGKM